MCWDPHYGDAEPNERGIWARVGRRIAKAPRATWLVTTVILAFLTLGMFQLDADGLTTAEQFRPVIVTYRNGRPVRLDQIARVVRSIRQLDLKKAPSVSETLDWARTLLLLNLESIDEKVAKETLHILLKYQSDITKATKELSTAGVK